MPVEDLVAFCKTSQKWKETKEEQAHVTGVVRYIKSADLLDEYCNLCAQAKAALSYAAAFSLCMKLPMMPVSEWLIEDASACGMPDRTTGHRERFERAKGQCILVRNGSVQNSL